MDVVGQARPIGLAAADRGDGTKTTLLHDAGEGVRLLAEAEPGEGTAEAEPSIEETYAAMEFARERAQMRFRCIELALAIRADKKGRVAGPCDSVLDDAKKLHAFVAEDEGE